MVTHNPLHRSRRAALPHRAPALGEDVEARPRVRVANMRGRKPAGGVATHRLPGEAELLAAPPDSAAAQLIHEPLGLLTMLKSNDEVVGETHDRDIAMRLPLPPPLDPEVEHIMEVDVWPAAG